MRLLSTVVRSTRVTYGFLFIYARFDPNVYDFNSGGVLIFDKYQAGIPMEKFEFEILKFVTPSGSKIQSWTKT